MYVVVGSGGGWLPATYRSSSMPVSAMIVLFALLAVIGVNYVVKCVSVCVRGEWSHQVVCCVHDN